MIERERIQAQQAFRAEAAREKAEAEAIVATRAEALTKAYQRQALQRLTAPVAGVVNEVSVTTLGEVAKAGQSLITIVPDGEDLIVQALVLQPSMSATVEVITGKRRVIEYLLSPIAKAVGTVGRER